MSQGTLFETLQCTPLSVIGHPAQQLQAKPQEIKIKIPTSKNLKPQRFLRAGPDLVCLLKHQYLIVGRSVPATVAAALIRYFLIP